MDRALVVVGDGDHAKRLAREAGELAAGVDAQVVLVHVTTEEAFTDRADALASIPNFDTTYTVEDAREGARQFAADIGSEVYEGLDVEYEAVGRLGDEGDEILAAADRYDCDHVFITGRQRSPTGKAVFGDVAQSVILNFDGPVTVVTA